MLTSTLRCPRLVQADTEATVEMDETQLIRLRVTSATSGR
jgi:hypothetical protein